jgi:hypothetical protein
MAPNILSILAGRPGTKRYLTGTAALLAITIFDIAPIE